MRDLRYRAWDTVEFNMNAKNQYMTIKKMVYFELTGLDESFILSSCTYIKENTKVMQYTGLKDKQGKMIVIKLAK
jgi:hypothetical protein